MRPIAGERMPYRSTKTTKTDFLILAKLSLLFFFYHVFMSLLSGYGYCIDKLYYIACSKRLALAVWTILLSRF